MWFVEENFFFFKDLIMQVQQINVLYFKNIKISRAGKFNMHDKDRIYLQLRNFAIIGSLALSIFFLQYHQLAAVEELNEKAVSCVDRNLRKCKVISTLLFKTGAKVLSSSSFFAQR